MGVVQMNAGQCGQLVLNESDCATIRGPKLLEKYAEAGDNFDADATLRP